MVKEIIYYTDNRLEKVYPELAQAVRKNIKKSGLPVISVSLKPLKFGRNISLPLKRGHLTMCKQILAGLELSDANIVFFAEHDVLYHPSHFDFVPPDKNKAYYNSNHWNYFYGIDQWRKHKQIKEWNPKGDKCIHYYNSRLSQLCAYRKPLLRHYRRKIELIKKRGFSMKMGFEPGTHHRPQRVDNLTSEKWQSKYPNIDVRHDRCFSLVRWKKEQFRNKRFTKIWKETTIDKLPGWNHEEIF